MGSFDQGKMPEKRFPWRLLWGSCISDRNGLLVHGIRISSQTDQNSFGHLTAGGNAFFHRSGKDPQQKETLETKSHIHGICKFLTRPQEVSEYCSILEPGRNPSSGGILHGSDTLAGAGCKAVFPGRGL